MVASLIIFAFLFFVCFDSRPSLVYLPICVTKAPLKNNFRSSHQNW